MKVLIVSYYFPPQNAIGALRIGKFAKYLANYEWEPWVLTLESGLFASAGELPIEIPNERIIRAGLGRRATAIAIKRRAIRENRPAGSNESAPASTSFSYFPSLLRKWREGAWAWTSSQFSDVRFPDRATPWVQPAIQKGIELLRREPFDALFSSHGPPSSHRVASRLAREFRLPWVADYRDLWSENCSHTRGKGLAWLEKAVERRCLKSASELTAASQPFARRLELLHGKRATEILNGFDEEDYRAIPLEKRQAFEIVYTGTIYPEQQDLSIIARALRRLIDSGALGPEKISLCFYGANRAQITKIATTHGIEDCVCIYPRVPIQESITSQINADMLLLLECASENQQEGWYPAKMYEYLGARRPILATGLRGGFVEALLMKTQSGELAADAIAASEIIYKWIKVKKLRGTTRLDARAEKLSPYTRRTQTGELASILTRVVDTSRRAS